MSVGIGPIGSGFSNVVHLVQAGSRMGHACPISRHANLLDELTNGIWLYFCHEKGPGGSV
jgi:hypothetical protein